MPSAWRYGGFMSRKTSRGKQPSGTRRRRSANRGVDPASRLRLERGSRAGAIVAGAAPPQLKPLGREDEGPEDAEEGDSVDHEVGERGLDQDEDDRDDVGG